MNSNLEYYEKDINNDIHCRMLTKSYQQLVFSMVLRAIIEEPFSFKCLCHHHDFTAFLSQDTDVALIIYVTVSEKTAHGSKAKF